MKKRPFDQLMQGLREAAIIAKCEHKRIKIVDAETTYCKDCKGTFKHYEV